MTDAATIRWATDADYDQLGEVMFDAVHNGRSAYSDAQRAAWTPEPRSGEAWATRLGVQLIILQENGAQVNGFISLGQGGHIDLAFIRPTAQGTGLFRRLYQRLERRAAENKEQRLWTHASLMAQPAFFAVGFTIVKRETVEISGCAFERFEMEKQLNAKGVD